METELTTAISMDEHALVDIATRATTEFRLARDAAVSMVEHAIACGEALLAAKAVVPAGAWLHWLQVNVPEISRSAVGRFTRMATYKAELSVAGEFQTVTQAVEFLTGRPPMSIRAPRTRRVSHGAAPSGHRFAVDEARELREAGLSYQQIGERVGAAASSIRMALDADAYSKKRADARARYVPRGRSTADGYSMAARQASVSRIGVAGIEAVGIMHRALAVVERAINESRDAPSRRALCEALKLVEQAESIVAQTIRTAT